MKQSKDDLNGLLSSLDLDEGEVILESLLVTLTHGADGKERLHVTSAKPAPSEARVAMLQEAIKSV